MKGVITVRCKQALPRDGFSQAREPRLLDFMTSTENLRLAKIKSAKQHVNYILSEPYLNFLAPCMVT